MKTHPLFQLLGYALVLAVLVVGGWLWLKPSHPAADHGIPGLLWPLYKTLPEFRFTDQDGQAFGLDQLRGHWSLLYFGYTHCPDICPTTLNELMGMKQRLAAEGRSLPSTTLRERSGVEGRSPSGVEGHGAEGTELRYVFVSVDPQRDDPASLKKYASYFDPALIALSAEETALAPLKRALGVVTLQTASRQGEPSALNYEVEHSAGLFLVDPEARLVATFSAPHYATSLAANYRIMRDYIAAHPQATP